MSQKRKKPSYDMDIQGVIKSDFEQTNNSCLDDSDLNCYSKKIESKGAGEVSDEDFEIPYRHNMAHAVKKFGTRSKKIHLDMKDLMDLTESEDGSKALTNPEIVARSSRDPNKGLYPRPPRKDPSLSGSFVKASELHRASSQVMPVPSKIASTRVSGRQSFSHSPRKSVGRSKLPPQKNSLDNYFPVSQKVKSNMPPKSPPSYVYSPIKKVDESNIYVMEGSSASHQHTNNCGRNNAPRSVSTNLFPESEKNQLMPKGRKKSNSVKSKKIQPTFNRDNTFLYSRDPIPKSTTSKYKDKYGLLGNGHCLPEEGTHIHINTLPYEILENIFCRLPLMNLCLNVNRVCTKWRDIICDEKFVPWKKRYHQIKLGREESIQHVSSLMKQYGMHNKETYLINLIRYMKIFKPVTAHNMGECLKMHPMYVTARALMDERLQDCIKNDQANPWAVITVLVILSEYVRDIEAIFLVLLSSDSQCLASEVIECMYAIATFMLMFRNEKYSEVWNGMHYRVFYALYLFENKSSTTTAELSAALQQNPSGQQSIVKYSTGDSGLQMTHEQQRICNHNVGKEETIKIVAFAGTGKTTTLVRYTQLRPNTKFLLVVYNKSVKEHAKTKFPRNVTCMTGHGLAFKHVGRRYAANNKLGSNLRVTEVLDIMTAVKGESMYVQAKLVIDTVNNYMASADECITTAHSPKVHIDNKSGKRKDIEYSMQTHYADQGQKVWDNMKDINNNRIKLPHDGYLKLYQLYKRKITGFDVLLIDEAQDITPAVADIIANQTMPKIMVGDPHQQIYSFRGAVNAMVNVQASHIFYLTQSFRFGPEIAHVASCCLEFLKNEKTKTLVGNGRPGSIRGDQEGQLAIITRSNFQLFVEAVKHCCFSNKDIRGVESFGFDMIFDIYILMLPPHEREKEREIKNYLVKKFSSLAELESYATKTMDNELLGKLKIVKTYNTAIPGHVQKIRSKAVHDNDVADIVFSTAHKAKGLEFHTVRVTDDFSAFPPDTIADTAQQKREFDDESNLLYVAITRAKKCLQISPTIYRLLRICGENFRYPVSSKLLQNESVVMRCAETERDFEPLTCTVVRREVRLGDSEDQIKQQIVYCPQWVTEDLTSLKPLFGSLQDERADLESVGRRRIKDMDIEENEKEDVLMFLDAPNQIFPFVAE